MPKLKNEHNQKKEFISQEQMVTILDEIYGKVLSGIPKVNKPVTALAEDYMKHNTPENAAKELINNQVVKCGTSGFITGLGGILTLPVALPANVTSVLYVQMRMIAAVAYIGGFDIYSDQVQTLVYACLTGSALADIVKQAGIKIGKKFAVAAIKKIPAKVLVDINKRVGFRLLTKFGTKGFVNIVEFVPLAGGIIGGVVDLTSTKIIARNSYNLFIKNIIPPIDAPKDTNNVFKSVFSFNVNDEPNIDDSNSEE